MQSSRFFNPQKRLVFAPILFLVGVFHGGCTDYSQQYVITEPRPIVRSRATAPVVQERWRAATAKERAAAQRVVQEQLRAFRDKDYKKALALETPELAGNYSTPAALKKLIEDVYPAFGRSQTIRWRRAHFNETSKTMLLIVNFTTSQGEFIGARYTLKLSKGKFLIDTITPRTIRERRKVANPWPLIPAF